MAAILSTLAIAFAAFCVWLTVRIVNRRERWPKRTVAAAVGLPVVYVASFGPACWIKAHVFPRQHAADSVTEFTYWPVLWQCVRGPDLLARVGYTYIENRNAWLQIPSLIPFSAWNGSYTVYDAGPTVPPCFSTIAGRCPVGTPITIWDIDPAYKGAVYSQTMYVNRTFGDHFGTIEATVIKRPGSGRWNARTYRC